MKLSNKDKEQLKRYIEEQLKTVPEGTRIHLAYYRTVFETL